MVGSHHTELFLVSLEYDTCASCYDEYDDSRTFTLRLLHV